MGYQEDQRGRDDFDKEEEWLKIYPTFGSKEVKTRKVGKLSINKTKNIEIPIKKEVFGKK